MKVHLQYGKQGIDVDIPSANVHVIAPKFVLGLPDETASFRDAVRKPVGTMPLKDCIRVHESVAVVIPDITRPLPTDRLLRWLFAKRTAMQPCHQRFEIVVTTNGGYPLDQNLYQTVKGMSAAKQIVSEGGLIVTASRCNDGFPFHGNFRQLLFNHASPQALLDTILAPGFSLYDQWEAQLLAMIRLKARVALKSDLPPDDVRRAHLEPITDVSACIAEELQRIGQDAPIAVLPEGPMTIPHLEVG